MRPSGARASVCVSRINALTGDPQAAQSPAPTRSESAAKQTPRISSLSPSITIQTSHRDDDDDTRPSVSKQSRTMRYYTKGEAKTLCRKMPPPLFASSNINLRFVKRLLELEFCGRHALPCTVCPGFYGGVGEGGGGHLRPQHKKPMELTHPPAQRPCSPSGGGGERLDIWQGVV